MADFTTLGAKELQGLKAELEKRYSAFQSRNLSLDMTRGKPSSQQLDLSLGMLDCFTKEQFKANDGTDCRNYGILDGIPEAKKLFAEYLEVTPDDIIIGGNSSLQLMYDTIISAMVHGVVDSDVPWGKLPKVKFLCPTPGYDRHFAVCESMQIEMINIELGDNGPDMDTIEKLVEGDDLIKGMWCVPKYSNPTGITYSNDTVDRLAKMRTKAKDFKLFWDNAYTVHHLTDKRIELKNILTACTEAGNSERPLIFGSTSKISFAGAGIAMIAGSKNNIDFRKKHIFFQTIGSDKLNQLRHVKFFKDLQGIENHMKKHAALLKPKFDAVQDVLNKELAGKNIASWSNPDGGYFVSLDTMDNCAKAVVDMAANGGTKLTPAGATFPYGKDPRDRNIRISPSLPSVEDIKLAMELVGICVQLMSISKLMK